MLVIGTAGAAEMGLDEVTGSINVQPKLKPAGADRNDIRCSGGGGGRGNNHDEHYSDRAAKHCKASSRKCGVGESPSIIVAFPFKRRIAVSQQKPNGKSNFLFSKTFSKIA